MSGGRGRSSVAASLGASAAALAGCSGVQSTLAPQGPEADRIALLSAVLFIGGAAIMAAVALLTAVALFGPERWRRRLRGSAMLVGGGIVFPVITLTVLLGYGLLVMRAGQSSAGAGDGANGPPLRLAVVGEQWWWRVVYLDADGTGFETANEIRIPVGRTVQIDLTAADVIHSFWVPNLAGKVDMIPGRTNRMHVAASVSGISRGQCAEYCGGAHALMAFQVVALPEDEFNAWLAAESGPARQPATKMEQRGQGLFMASGCGGCHAVRGSGATGSIGPDLTHVGSRLTIAAATLLADKESFAIWIADGQHIKPGNLMPPYRIFSQDELDALAVYLVSLK